MKRFPIARTRLGLILLYGLMAATALPRAFVTTQDRPAGTGEISGIVVDAIDGHPIGGVRVELGRVPDESTRFPMGIEFIVTTGFAEQLGPVMTRADGRFTFTNVAPGTFEVSAERDGWIGGEAYQRDWKTRGHMVMLGEGQRITGVRTPLWKRPVLSGRVIDEREQPLPGVSVEIVRPDSRAGHAWYHALNSSNWTDDRGMFVLSADAGESLVAAFVRLSNEFGDTIRARKRDGRTMVYESVLYPHARSLDEATRIQAVPGEERGGLDLQLRPVPGFTVTSTVTGLDNHPVRVWLVRAGISGWNSGGVPLTVDADTRFTVQNIPPGSYELHALLWPEMPFRTHSVAPLESLPPEPTLWAEASVTVTDRNVEVPLVLREGVRIDGRVEFEGSALPPPLRGLNQQPIVVDRADGGGSDVRGLFLPDGRFATIQAPPGRYLISVEPPPGWRLKSVMADGRDVADVPLEVGSVNIRDVVITFAERLATLRGRVSSLSSDGRRRAWVTIFPTDRERWIDYGLEPRAIQMLLTGARGDYAAELPAGRYYVVATEEELGDVRTPDVFALLAAMATEVVVGDRETKTQDLVVQRGRR